LYKGRSELEPDDFFAYRLRPNDPEIRDELAELCDKLDKRELARTWRRAARQLRHSGGSSDPAR